MQKRILIAGATGVIGVRLIPILIGAGYDIVGMTRSITKLELLRELGATPLLCDVYDRKLLLKSVLDFAPDIVMHQLTDLPDESDLIPSFVQANNRIRTEGTFNLVESVRQLPKARIIAQSVAWKLPDSGEDVVKEHEKMVLEIGGTVLRYGRFYGPGTYFVNDLPENPRIHIDEAALSTLLAINTKSGIVTISE
jgi:nucleoside-diphosphate-sugar epimerase